MSGFLRPDDLTVIFSTGSGLVHAYGIADGRQAHIDPHATNVIAVIESVLRSVTDRPATAGAQP
jgi:hypothetical protein